MQDIDYIKKSEITSYAGEVFYGEMLFILGDYSNKKIWIKNRGMNSRALSKDIIDITSYNYVVHDNIKEAVFIHLSRNSVYHQLPESFFHPLVISTPTMSNAEVVSAIKKNREIEEDNIQFFIPFDTHFFEKKVELANRYINIFTDKDSKKVLFNLSQRLIDKEIPFSKEKYYKLFLNLCNSESFKENLPELEQLLQRVMGYEVTLNYVKHTHSNSPFSPLGTGILGFTFGTQGDTVCEFDNVSATMIVTEEVDYKTIKQDMTIIRMILEYFIFSNRDIILKFQTKVESNIVLGENYLGYNTILSA